MILFYYNIYIYYNRIPKNTITISLLFIVYCYYCCIAKNCMNILSFNTLITFSITIAIFSQCSTHILSYIA